jgi:branched-chain amino acid transport system ATP-binding protein
MLRVEHVDVRYGDLQVIWDVNLEVHEGEIVALVGSNGAGKSTLIRTIAGLHKPSEGTIYYGDTLLNDRPPHKIAESGISMVPEGRRLFPKMSVLQNLEMGAFLKRARSRKDATLAWVHDIFPILRQRASQPAGLLSGGEQQMLAIGRALMGLNRFLLLDELSLGLSPMLVKQIFEVLRQINKAGITLFIVEQNVPMTLKIANRAYIMETGRIVGQGLAGDLMESSHVREAYLGMSDATTG